MKSIKKALYLISCLLISFSIISTAGCSKDEIEPNGIHESDKNQKFLRQRGINIPDLTPCYTNINYNNGLLQFSDFTSLENTLSCLAQKTELMDDDFLANWGHLNDSILNNQEDSLGYHIELTFEAFENHFGHLSLRSKINAEMDIWLSDSIVDTTNIPGHVIGDTEFQTILNSNGSFMVGNDIYHIEKNGTYYKITNGSFAILNSIIAGTFSGNNPNVEIHSADGSKSCRGIKSDKRWKYHNSYAIYMKSGFYNISSMCRWYAKTKSKKRKNGKYKSYRVSNLGVGINGTRYSKNGRDCGNESESYAVSKAKRRSSISISRTDFHDPGRWLSYGHVGGHSSPKVYSGSVYYTSPNW